MAKPTSAWEHHFVTEACFEDVCDECGSDVCWCECHEEADDGV